MRDWHHLQNEPGSHDVTAPFKMRWIANTSNIWKSSGIRSFWHSPEDYLFCYALKDPIITSSQMESKWNLF